MSHGISAFGDGLDMRNLDVITPEEEANFRAFYQRVKGDLIPAHAFMLEFRPDLLKRHRAFARQVTDVENEKYPLVHTLSHLHLYAVDGFGEGVAYEITQARAGGAARSDVLDTLGVASLLAGPRGLAAVAKAATEALRAWPAAEPGKLDRFPPHWACDHDRLGSGLTFTEPAVLEGEVERMRSWYLDTLGELPPYASLLLTHRPAVLKAHRSRLEASMRSTLPVQALPWFQIHHAVASCWRDGVREPVLLGRALGLRQSELVDAVCWGMFYGGAAGLSAAAEAAGDLLPALS